MNMNHHTLSQPGPSQMVVEVLLSTVGLGQAITSIARLKLSVGD